MNKFTGTGVAIVTPFKNDLSSIESILDIYFKEIMNVVIKNKKLKVPI